MDSIFPIDKASKKRICTSSNTKGDEKTNGHPVFGMAVSILQLELVETRSQRMGGTRSLFVQPFVVRLEDLSLR